MQKTPNLSGIRLNLLLKLIKNVNRIRQEVKKENDRRLAIP